MPPTAKRASLGSLCGLAAEPHGCLSPLEDADLVSIIWKLVSRIAIKIFNR